jgi:hypothetical protein
VGRVDYKEILSGDPEALGVFTGGMDRFITKFCEAMNRGERFTLSIELHGNRGKLLTLRHRDDITTHAADK